MKILAKVRQDRLVANVQDTFVPTGLITKWLNEHITQPTNLVLDDTLTVSGAAADAKTTGDAVSELMESVSGETSINYTEGKNFSATSVNHEIIDDTEACISDYIPITWGDNKFCFRYTDDSADNKKYQVWFFDNNKDYVDFVVRNPVGSNYRTGISNKPNSAYVRISFKRGFAGQVTENKVVPDVIYYTAAESTIVPGLTQKVGNLASLKTTEKTSLVGAVNEVHTAIKNDLQSGTILSIAHRGNYSGGRGMMCGASAVIAAKRAGYRIVENDVALSSDGKMVMWHDTTLARIGDSSHGVSDYTLSELKEMDFGSAFGSQFAGEQILTFAEWILLCKKVGVSCYIDFKVTGSAFTDALAQELVTTVKHYGMLDKVTYLANLSKIRQYHPDARLAVLAAPTQERVQVYAQYLSGGDVAFNPKSTELTAENAALALDYGFGLECWCVDYASNGFSTKSAVFDEIERVVELGVQRITLDAYRVEDVFDERYELS